MGDEIKNSLIERTATNLAVLTQRFIDHTDSDEKRFRTLEAEINRTGTAISDIKNNHLAHIQSSMSEMQNSLYKNTTDTDWLKRFFWIVATASIGSLVAGVLNLLVTK